MKVVGEYMKIGLLITSIGNFGQKGFYNAQEIGLAKALDKYFVAVYIYKLVPESMSRSDEKIENAKNVILHSIPSKSFGINGLLDMSVLDTTLDVLIYFSDTQISVPKVCKWAVKNKVKFYPYVGVLESHSTSKWKKLMMDTLFNRNLNVYRKSHCFVKTPTVEKKLRSMGVDKISVMPVGLDLSLLRQDYESADKIALKEKYGFDAADKVLLFIGRLIDEKQPVRMIDILNQIRQRDKNYKLLMVGTGPLRAAVDEKIRGYGLNDAVKLIDKIPNNDIWELYRFADCFVNLNQQEIFGMAILEAMYYGCKVVAWRAPGPEFIIEDGKSGYLVEDESSICKRTLLDTDISIESHKRILQSFTWENAAKVIRDLVLK